MLFQKRAVRIKFDIYVFICTVHVYAVCNILISVVPIRNFVLEGRY